MHIANFTFKFFTSDIRPSPGSGLSLENSIGVISRNIGFVSNGLARSTICIFYLVDRASLPPWYSTSFIYFGRQNCLAKKDMRSKSLLLTLLRGSTVS